MQNFKGLLRLGQEIVEGVTGETFPGEIKVSEEEYCSRAFVKGRGFDGSTTISPVPLRKGLLATCQTMAHELKHHLDPDFSDQDRRELRAGSFAGELARIIEETPFSQDDSIRFKAAERFGALKPLSEQEVTDRYRQSLKSLGQGRINETTLQEAARVLAQEDLKHGVLRAEIDETVLKPHHVAMVQEHDAMKRTYHELLANPRRR